AAGTASGYLTARSARVFGAALAARPGRLFGRGTSISLAGTSLAAARSAQAGPGQVSLEPAASARGLAVHTLTFHADNFLGQPDTGDTVFLVNVDNSDLF